MDPSAASVARSCYILGMYKKVKVRKMGGSVGITLPREIAEKLKVAEGEEVYLVEAEGGILVTSGDPEFASAMEAYQRGARKYRNALRELAE